MTAVVEQKARRGTTNRNDRGSAETRRRRRAWLITTYRANVDLERSEIRSGDLVRVIEVEVPCGEGNPACRCYRCGTLLDAATVTIDRIVPGCQGGTYRRDNIRPACGPCNSETGGSLRASRRI